MARLENAWSDLAGRTLEPNVFLDPGFLLPLAQHARSAERPDFVLAWEDDGSAPRRLVGLFAIHQPASAAWPVPRLLRGFHHPQMALGTPLVDADRAEDALVALLDALSARHPRHVGLVLREVPADGAFAQVLQAAEARRRGSITVLETYQRAVLVRDAGAGDEAATLLSAKQRKELRRQGRRLAEHGTLAYARAVTPAEVRAAIERFLVLECDGWKGGRGTALLASPTLATFTRTMSRLLAYDGRCRVDSLEIDGKPVAMGIILVVGARAFFWKTAFDERHARLSPGVQFAVELSRAQREAGFAMTDSCAVPDHPMIDRLWPDRMALADVLVELRPGAGLAGFAVAARTEPWRRRARAFAKSLAKSMLANSMLALAWRGARRTRR